MGYLLRKKHGQSTAEYAVVLSLVIAAVIGMQVFVKRGLQARTKAGADAFTNVGRGFNFSAVTNSGVNSVVLSNLSQYEPYYAESTYDTYSENIEQEHMGGGKVIKEKVSDLQVRRAGGKNVQRGNANATQRDALWNTTFNQ